MVLNTKPGIFHSHEQFDFAQLVASYLEAEAQNQEFQDGIFPLIKKKIGKNRYQCGVCHPASSKRNEIKGRDLNCLGRHLASVTHRNNRQQRQCAESEALQLDRSIELLTHTAADEQQNDGIDNTLDNIDASAL